MLPSNTPTLEQYKQALKRFDWLYEYSDDMSVVRAGMAQVSELRRMQAQLDPSGEIWKQHRPGTGPLPVVSEVKVHG